VSALLLPPSIPTLSRELKPSTAPSTPWESPTGARANISAAPSPLIATTHDIHLTMLAGALLSVIAVVLSVIFATAASLSVPAIGFSTLSVVSMAGCIFFALPPLLRTQHRLGTGIGFWLITCLAFVIHAGSWTVAFCDLVFCGLAYTAVLFDNAPANSPQSAHDAHKSNGHIHAHEKHNHDREHKKHSALTAYLLKFCVPGSIMYNIMQEKDSRRIAYFGTSVCPESR